MNTIYLVIWLALNDGSNVMLQVPASYEQCYREAGKLPDAAIAKCHTPEQAADDILASGCELFDIEVVTEKYVCTRGFKS